MSSMFSFSMATTSAVLPMASRQLILNRLLFLCFSSKARTAGTSPLSEQSRNFFSNTDNWHSR
ncbi:hypothetical protein X975_09605, partial [Stegodyphus mimosarum]